MKIGVLGLANIATRSFIPTIKELSDIYNFIGIASRDFIKAKKFSKENSCIAFKNYEDIIYNGKLDAIYIPLPNSLHYKWAKLALEKNINVLSEKPLTSSLLQTKDLIEIARKNKLIIFETFQFRFHKQLKIIKDLINNDSIGEIRYMKATFCFPPFSDLKNIRYQKNLDGGCLLDAGAYTAKISQIILGYNLNVLGASMFVPEDKDVETFGSAILQNNRKDKTSFLHFGFDNFYQCSLEILGSLGKIYTDRIFTAPFDYEPNIKVINNNYSDLIKVGKDNHFINMLRYFYDLLNDKSKFENEYISNLDQARILEDIKNKSKLSD